MSEPGRPSTYSDELAKAILERVADGESLRSICRSEEMPGRTTVYRWAIDDIGGFRDQFARAREMRAHMLEDDLTEIADDGANDWMERNDPNNPGWVANGEHLNRSRLRVDTRKWIASKILPKVYGEKITQEVVSENVHRVMSETPTTQADWAAKYSNGAEPVTVPSDDAT